VGFVLCFKAFFCLICRTISFTNDSCYGETSIVLFVQKREILMKLCATRFATAVAITVLLSKLVHLAMFKFMPEMFMKTMQQMLYLVDIAKYKADFEFNWTSFGLNTVHCVLGAFVMTWVAVALYNMMIKE